MSDVEVVTQPPKGVDRFEHDERVAEVAGSYNDGVPDAKKIRRKIDINLLPVLTFLYVLAFLDRGNMGNAKVAGMNAELKLTGSQYNLACTIFFLPYACFEIPSNVVLKILKPSTWLACIIFAWGTILTLQGIVQGYRSLYATRLLMGLSESGFFPASSYLLTTWYTRYELQTRLGIFWAAGSLAAAFSGLLAFAIESMDGIGGLSGWRWIFILEGIFTCICACFVPWILPDSPALARFLTQDEKVYLQQRLIEDSGSRDEPFQWNYLWSVLKEWRIYIAVVIYWGNSIALYAFIYAAPSIIFDMGYTTAQAQLLTVPVYVVAMLSTIGFSKLADMHRKRWLFIVIPYTFGLIGYIACLLVPHPRLPGLTYAFLFFIPAGVNPPLMAIVAWVANNLAPSWKRAIGMGMLTSLGALGAAVGSNLFLEEQKPRYWLGYGFCVGIVLAAINAALALRYLWSKENMERKSVSEREIRARYTEEQLNEMGDKSPLFEYTI